MRILIANRHGIRSTLIVVFFLIFSFFRIPLFLSIPLCSLTLSILLLNSTLSKKTCLNIWLFSFLPLTLFNLLADPSIIYNSPPGDFQAYYSHSLDLNPQYSSKAYASPINTLWLTEPVIRIFYFLASRFSDENFYLVTLSLFFTVSYLYICYKISPTKNHFVLLAFFVFSFKVPFFVQGIWLVRQDISWLFFWLSIACNDRKFLRIIFLTFSVLSHNTIVAMFALTYVSSPFQPFIENVFSLKPSIFLVIRLRQLVVRLVLSISLFTLLYLAYSLIEARGSLETNSLIQTSPPVFVFAYSLLACLFFFYRSSFHPRELLYLSETVWGLFVTTICGLALIPFGGIFSMRQASGVVMVAPIVLVSILLTYLSKQPSLKSNYNIYGTILLLFSFFKFSQNLYSPASYQTYLIPITHSSIFNLLT